MPLAIVGPGRAGIGLALALRDAGGYALAGAAARTRASAARASRLLGRGIGTTDLSRAVRPARVVLLTVPDDGIAAATASLARLRLKGKVILHTSGARTAAAIGGLRARGAAVGSLHPLTSFPAPTGIAPDLRGTFFAVDGDAAAVRAARRIARSLRGRTLLVAGPARPAYHLAASMVANHLVVLLEAGFDLAARRLAVRPATARAALMPLVNAALRNVGRAGPGRALTGPVARGDVATVAQHLRVLAAEPPGLAEMYLVLSRKAVDIALADGRLSPERARAMRRLLARRAGRSFGPLRRSTRSLTRSRRSLRMPR